MRAASTALRVLKRYHSKLNVAALIDVDLWCPSCPLQPTCPQHQNAFARSVFSMNCHPLNDFLFSCFRSRIFLLHNKQKKKRKRKLSVFQNGSQVPFILILS